MSNAHSPANCTATNCGRVHVGDGVRVVVEQVGFGNSGEVLEISPLGAIKVSLPDGAYNAAEYGMTQAETEIMHYLESELEIVSL